MKKIFFAIVLIAFVSGWLFANEYPPPDVRDLGMAVWFVGLAIASLGAMVR